LGRPLGKKRELGERVGGRLGFGKGKPFNVNFKGAFQLNSQFPIYFFKTPFEVFEQIFYYRAIEKFLRELFFLSFPRV